MYQVRCVVTRYEIMCGYGPVMGWVKKPTQICRYQSSPDKNYKKLTVEPFLDELWDFSATHRQFSDYGKKIEKKYNRINGDDQFFRSSLSRVSTVNSEYLPGKLYLIQHVVGSSFFLK